MANSANQSFATQTYTCLSKNISPLFLFGYHTAVNLIRVVPHLLSLFKALLCHGRKGVHSSVQDDVPSVLMTS